MPRYRKVFKPSLIPKEFSEQAQIITWARSHQVEFPCLVWLHSSLNGIPLSGSIRTRGRIMNKMKAEGLVKGIFDLCLPFPNSRFHGLYIEVKRITGGRTSTEQKRFLNYLIQHGYFAVVCKGHLEGIKYLKEYLEIS